MATQAGNEGVQGAVSLSAIQALHKHRLQYPATKLHLDRSTMLRYCDPMGKNKNENRERTCICFSAQESCYRLPRLQNRHPLPDGIVSSRSRPRTIKRLRLTLIQTLPQARYTDPKPSAEWGAKGSQAKGLHREAKTTLSKRVLRTV